MLCHVQPQPVCDAWYAACREHFYYRDISDRLRMCSEESTVCAALHSFIANGTEFCSASGFEVNHVYLDCFDAQKEGNIEGNKKKRKKLIADTSSSSASPSSKHKKAKKKKKKKKLSAEDRELQSIRKKLKKNQQSEVPWLESTVSASAKKKKKSTSSKAKTRNKKKKKKKKKSKKKSGLYS